MSPLKRYPAETVDEYERFLEWALTPEPRQPPTGTDAQTAVAFEWERRAKELSDLLPSGSSVELIRLTTHVEAGRLLLKVLASSTPVIGPGELLRLVQFCLDNPTASRKSFDLSVLTTEEFETWQMLLKKVTLT
jgi:hypothetical protein